MKFGLPIVFIASLLAACGGGSAAVRNVSPTCGPPPPSAAPNVVLIYPEPSATGVPTTIGAVVIGGAVTTRYGTGTLTMQDSSGSSVPVGAYTAAPSPLPTPHATSAAGAGVIAAPLPMLSPATTYSIRHVHGLYRRAALVHRAAHAITRRF